MPSRSSRGNRLVSSRIPTLDRDGFPIPVSEIAIPPARVGKKKRKEKERHKYLFV